MKLLAAKREYGLSKTIKRMYRITAQAMARTP